MYLTVGLMHRVVGYCLAFFALSGFRSIVLFFALFLLVFFYLKNTHGKHCSLHRREEGVVVSLTEIRRYDFELD